MDLTPGAVIAGRYRVERKVGAGGMGEVWAGEHRVVGSRVAIKTLLAAAALNHEVVARFKREALILGKIRSDHVARVVDFVADDVYGLVLVMDFVEGEPLNRVLQEKMLTVEETIDLGVDIASALCDLHHAHIVHRDLKPGNIILQTLQGGRIRAVVVDFGVSRLMSGSEPDGDDEVTGITRADMAVGTIEYMAPEQILNSRAVTSTSDIYATGAILFRAVAGRHVFGNIASDAELAQKKLMTEAPLLTLQRDDKVAQGLIHVVTRALRRKPVDRYQSAEELLKELLPLRDLARAAAAAIDVEKTIGQGAPIRASVASMPELAPTSAPTPSQAASNNEGRLSLATPVPALDARPSAPERRGVPVAVMVAAIGAALIGGAVMGSGILKPAAPGATVESTPAVTAHAAPSIASPSIASPSMASPSIAPPAPTPSASAATATPNAVDTAPAVAASAPKKLWGSLPKASGDPTAPPPANTDSGGKAPIVVKPPPPASARPTPTPPIVPAKPTF